MGSNLHMKCTLVACHLPALMLLHLPLHFLYDFDLNLDATYCCTSKLTVDRKTLKAYRLGVQDGGPPQGPRGGGPEAWGSGQGGVQHFGPQGASG